MRCHLRLPLCVVSLTLALIVPSILIAESAHPGGAPQGHTGQHPTNTHAAGSRRNYGLLPLNFEPNRGQADARVQFLARNQAYSLYLTADGMTLALRDAAAPDAKRASLLRIKLLGANARPRAYGLDELEGRSNYLIGRDPSRWRTNVPHYARVKYEGVYPGIAVVYYGQQRQLEYDFELAPGANPGLIRLRVEGADTLRLDANGDLVLATAAGELRQRAPHAYQEVEGVRRTVACRYVMRGARLVGFELGAYDRGRPLVIDPVISYSTYLGGGSYDDASAVAVDSQGHAYVTGSAASWDFPVTGNALQPRRGGLAAHQVTYDAFVSKLSPDGTSLLYSTYLGGRTEDGATSIAVDAQGQAHVAGWTESSDFPFTPGAFRTTYAGSKDIFVSKLSPDGTSLLYSTFLGGSFWESDAHLALGAGGAIYVGGRTESANFPVTPGAFQIQPGTGTYGNPADGFVTKLSTEPGAGLIFSTFLGGNRGDSVEGLAVAPDDSVYVTGRTESSDFPVTPGAFQTAHGSGGWLYDAFVTRLNPAGQAVYSTYFGGASDDFASAVAVDAQGHAYVVGITSSPALPTTPGAFQTAYVGGSPDPTRENDYDAFVTKFSPAGDRLVYSTFFGGNGGDKANAVAVDASGNAYVAGETSSTDLPVPPGALQADYGGGHFDGFFIKLNEAGSGLPYASYLGGGDWEQVRGLALDSASDLYLAGVTHSYNFITTPLALQPYFGGGSDAFVTKVALSALDHSVSGRVTNQFHVGLRDVEIAVTGGVNRVVRTDAEGFYWVSGLPPGAEVTLTASRHGFVFDPAEVTLSDIRQDQTVNFSGPAPLVISGRITNDFGYGVYIPITIEGTVSGSVYTNYDGTYSFLVPAGGNYTLTPGPDPEYTFAPPSHSFYDLIGDVTLDFAAQRPPRLLARVVDDYNVGIPNINLTLTGATLPEPLTMPTDAYGYVFFNDLERGATYTVTPSDPDTNRSFVPSQQTVTNLQREEFGVFTALPPLAIGGRVADPNGQPVTGVATLSGGVAAEVQIDEWGYFFFPNLPRGRDYTVTVTKPGSLYTFSPPSRSVTDLQDFQFFDFTALPPLRLVGRVADTGNNGLRATVTLSGTVSATTQADEYGFYSFEELPRGGDYTVTPSYPLYTFTPASHSATNAQEMMFFEFMALPPLRLVGEVRDEQGVGIAGASVTLAGAVNATTAADEFGIFRFENLPRGAGYTVTPAHDLYLFTPPSRELPALSEDQFVFFDGVRRKHQIGGRVADSSGAPLAGVTVTLGGASAATAQTDADGRYLFADLLSGLDYTLTAAKTHYNFSPPARQVEDLAADATADFTATLLTHSISGRVVDVNGNGFSGAIVSLIGTSTGSVTTDASGNYSFNSLPAGGNYTVRPSREFYDFTPSVAGYLDLGGDQTANFTAVLRTFSIGGRVAEGAAGVAGVTVQLTGSRTASAQTDANGDYLFASLPADGTYNVAPAHPFYSLSPGGASFNTLPFNQTANFAAARLLHGVSGYALDACGRAIPGVTMSLTRGGLTANAQTDTAGFYSFANVQAGYDYTLAPAGSTYTFTPPSFFFPALNATQAANFTGRPPTSTIETLPLADLYVRGGSATSNFGTATQLITRLANQAKDTHETYLKFSAGAPCTVSSVKLRLYGKLSSNGTIPVAVYAVPSTSWTETGTTWNNKPAAGALLRTVNVVGTTAAWYEWDVTDYVRAELAAGRGTVAFVLKATTATSYQATFNSREATGANGPRLDVTSP